MERFFKTSSQNVLEVKAHQLIVPSLQFTSTTKNNVSEKADGGDVDITGNPFFEKYKAKIQHMQQ